MLKIRGGFDGISKHAEFLGRQLVTTNSLQRKTHLGTRVDITRSQHRNRFLAAHRRRSDQSYFARSREVTASRSHQILNHKNGTLKPGALKIVARSPDLTWH